MTISPTVSITEATKSQTAIRNGIDNTPGPAELEAMRAVADKIIEPVRRMIAGVAVSSFYRSPKLNKKVGGSTSSQHTKGEAVDLDTLNDQANLEVFNFIKDNLTFDQLILEYPSPTGIPSWVHASYVMHPKVNRRQILVKLKDKYIPFGQYQKGMV